MMKRRKATMLALLLAAGIAYSIPIERSFHQCAACRLGRRDHSWLGLTWSRYQRNECSDRYADVVEPQHGHVWVRHSCTRLMSAFGGTWGFACGPGFGPLFDLSPEMQAEVYRHFDDPLEAKRLFLGLADDSKGEAREAADHSVLAIHRWALAGFPGTWDEWRAAHPDRPGDGP